MSRRLKKVKTTEKSKNTRKAVKSVLKKSGTKSNAVYTKENLTGNLKKKGYKEKLRS